MMHEFTASKSTMKTDTWVLELSRKLTSEEWGQISSEIHADNALAVWDDKGREFSLPVCLFIVQKVCADVTAESWEHKPFNVLVKSIGLPKKVFVIEGAMSIKYAIDKAKETWKEQYGWMGMKATIISVGLATKRDMKGMMSS